jgi:hypothetical protein
MTTTVGLHDEALRARRAIEALRCGVPNRDAVAVLGSGQDRIEDRFVAVLDAAGTTRGSGSRSLLIGGGFGAGKSHVLEHLATLARDRGFVVSRIVISKETPLHDPAKVLRAAIESAVLPGGAEDAVPEAAAALDTDTPAYAEFLHWVSTSGAVDERFALTLSLLPRVRTSDADFAELIVRFWSGDPISTTELRRQSRRVGRSRPSLPAVPARQLARQRFRFLARLFAAAGYEGWVLLFDEVELIGRYTPLQRGRSYAELAGWLRADPDDPASPMVSVVAMTDDFDAAVLTAKGDHRAIPEKLRAKQTAEFDVLASAAEAGMRAVERSMIRLQPPDEAELARTYGRLKVLHGEAFEWDPPDVPGLERLGATRMRQYVRAWINEWDLSRLDPSFRPATEVAQVRSSYDESPELERSPDPD